MPDSMVPLVQRITHSAYCCSFYVNFILFYIIMFLRFTAAGRTIPCERITLANNSTRHRVASKVARLSTLLAHSLQSASWLVDMIYTGRVYYQLDARAPERLLYAPPSPLCDASPPPQRRFLRNAVRFISLRVPSQS